MSGHALAGLIDAEAHFGISEQNGGGSASCTMVLAMRDDDVDLLRSAVRTTGVGVVRTKDRRGNVQAAWFVYRKAEASALVGFLERFPLRSRKLLDFQVWSAAVECWQSDEAGRLDRLKELGRVIRAVRAYRDGDRAVGSPRLAKSGFSDWLGGFIAGDGCFGVSDGARRLTVKLRADDAPLLTMIRQETGAGNVTGPYANEGAHPSVAWTVTRTADLVALAERLDGRIPGRKRLEFDVWRLAVAARADRTRTRLERKELIDAAERELRQLRRYRPGKSLPSAKSRRLQQMYEQNGVWIALLREWAAVEPGPLSAERYQRARRDAWPSRNTLATRFGSWYDALAAAGLGDRAALAPEVRDRKLRAGAQAREHRRRLQRERVIAAFRRCQQALGRAPGPTEYARWRLHNDPSAPSFGTAYRHFPGGWSELHAACAASATWSG